MISATILALILSQIKKNRFASESTVMKNKTNSSRASTPPPDSTELSSMTTKSITRPTRRYTLAQRLSSSKKTGKL